MSSSFAGGKLACPSKEAAIETWPTKRNKQGRRIVWGPSFVTLKPKAHQSILDGPSPFGYPFPIGKGTTLMKSSADEALGKHPQMNTETRKELLRIYIWCAQYLVCIPSKKGVDPSLQRRCMNCSNRAKLVDPTLFRESRTTPIVCY